MIEFPLLFL